MAATVMMHSLNIGNSMFGGLDVANLLERELERTAITKENAAIAEKLQENANNLPEILPEIC